MLMTIVRSHIRHDSVDQRYGSPHTPDPYLSGLVTGIGSKYYVRLNGQLINVASIDGSNSRLVGIQNFDPHRIADNSVEFGVIRVKELPDDAKSYHVLFDSTKASRLIRTGNRMFDNGRQSNSQMLIICPRCQLQL